VRRLQALQGRGLEALIALLAYAVFTVYLTWPLAAHLDSTVYLVVPNPPGPGDLAGSIAHLRELVEAHRNPFLPGRIDSFNAPDGLEIRWALNLASLPSTLVLVALAAVFGATAAFGLFVLAGYIASGLAMFLFVRRLTGSAWIAFVLGWAFAFYPFAVVKGEHPHFVHGWVFVVMAWRMVEVMEAPTIRNGLWAGAAAVLALAWTQYFILLGGVAFLAMTLFVLAVAVARHRLRRQAVALLPAVGLVAAFGLGMRALLALTNEDATLPGNTFADVVAPAARLPMYVVPPAHHPLGGATVSYLEDHGWNGVEWTLYVGLTVLALALVGLSAAAVRRLPPPIARVAGLAAVLVVVGVLFSLPPQVESAGSTVPMPSWLVFEVSPNWRLYGRFVLVVMLGLCVLAALGLRTLTEGRSPRAAAAVLGLATLLVPLDLWDRPPRHSFEIETPRIYRTLRAQPPGIVAEYPLRSIERVGHYLDLYFQDAHGKPILNGYYSGPFEQRALALSDLSDPGTASHLATLGVRYALITPQRLVPGVPDPGRPGRGFSLIARDGYGSLYRVVARPTPFVYSRSGLEPAEGPPGAEYRWASNRRIELEVNAPCERCEGELRFTASSLGEPRLLSVEIRGKTLPLALVQGQTDVALPVAFDRRTKVVLTTKPGPRPIREVTGLPDPRSVSISVRRLRFVPARP
jgi:hypothetical protein